MIVDDERGFDAPGNMRKFKDISRVAYVTHSSTKHHAGYKLPACKTAAYNISPLVMGTLWSGQVTVHSRSNMNCSLTFEGNLNKQQKPCL